MKLKLFLTFDHELPLGVLKTSYESSLFEPTRKVMELADKLDVKVTLFTDILCASRFKEWDFTNFYTPYKNQLVSALKNGHDVQLHIHPHWLTSTFEEGKYTPSSDFGLSDFVNNQAGKGVDGIIKQGAEELTQLCVSGNPAYKCIAFRAGGFNIAPATKQIMTALYANGIRYDSSMARGYYFKSGISEVDFRKLPESPNWVIDPDNYHVALDSEGILEIPIATMHKTPFEIPTMFKLTRYAQRAPLNHGTMIHEGNHNSLAARIKMLLSVRFLSFDNYTVTLDYLLRIVRYTIRRYKSSDTIMLSILSHPKSMGSYSFELMEGFIKEIHKRYPDAEFMTFSQLYNTQSPEDHDTE